jgi:hypothetical protein
MPQSRTLSVGMAVHTDSLAVASVVQDHGAAVGALGHSGPRPWDLDQRIRRRPSKSPPLVCVSAAGPCGSWLSPSLTHKGHGGWGGAPALIPTKPGERVTPNRRDAIPRARLRRSGDRTPVSGPPVDAAAMRALGRAREDAIHARKAAQCRRTAFLLRQDSR